MKIAYLDCFSGISGDMYLGALLDAGVPLEKLSKELRSIPLRGYEIRARKVKRAGISSTKVDVILKGESQDHKAGSNPTPLIPPLVSRYDSQPRGDKEGFQWGGGWVKSKEQGAKRWKDIEKIIHKSSLSKEIKEKGLEVFKRLFKAEAKIHGSTFQKVHLHELGAVDVLVDVFGTIIGFNILAVEKIYSSPVNLGSGLIKTEHGILPVPSPASAEILRGVPVYSTDSNFELTTPTGAVLVRELSSEFGNLPLMNIETIGLGAGSKNFKDRPNVLRLFVGNLQDTTPLWKRGVRGDFKGVTGELSEEKITVIEANLDDMNPQVYEYVMDKLFKKGAIDVFLTQVIMKKGRPGIKLTVLSRESDREDLIKTIFTETTTIGLRFYDVQRRVLQREIKLIETEFGKIRVKFSRLGDNILKATPEYEDCKKIAKKLNMPLIEVMKRIKIPPK